MSIPAPEAVTERPDQAGPDEQQGLVESNVTHGAVLVQHKDGRQFRLSWGEGDGSEDAEETGDDAAEMTKPVVSEPRALPVGEYFLRGYRWVRENDEGQRWFLSATGQDLKRFEVAAGKTLRLEMPDQVALTHTALQVRNQVKVCLGFQVFGHAGVSLYRDGVRVPLRCQLLDGNGEVVATRRADYG